MWQDKYKEWRDWASLEGALKNELQSISDEDDLEDRFYRYLEFGTGGMRGELGVGTNRINSYTIKRVALALGTYIKEEAIDNKQQSVVISYDNRHGSKDFAIWTAKVLASLNILVYVSDAMRPTPELSFLVRHLKTTAGVMITASHNPKQYNGFKVYGPDGGQITLETAHRLMAILENLTDELDIRTESLDYYQAKELISFYGEKADDAYLRELKTVLQQPELVKKEGYRVAIAYTPLHGTGEKLITEGFKEIGFKNLNVLAEQANGDPNFSTVDYPNPEDPKAFELLLRKNTRKDIDLFLATDPDADRLGAVILNGNDPILFSGNQIGVLLLDYLIEENKKEGHDLTQFFVAKSIVTSDLGKHLAKAYGVETRETLTGFKFIGEQIELAEKQKNKIFLFGYEESFGYLVKAYVRDKDAIQASTLMAELTLANKLKGKTLTDRLTELYETYGYYKEDLDSISFKGQTGHIKMEYLLQRLRQSSLKTIGNFEVKYSEDYLIHERLWVSEGRRETIELPTSNVLKFVFSDDSWLCIRPSGTEPKCKIYYSVNGSSDKESSAKLKTLQKAFENLLDELNGE